MTKYVFVTGGVVSGLGKGIVAASLGRLLKARELKVAPQKLDPYINVDPAGLQEPPLSLPTKTVPLPCLRSFQTSCLYAVSVPSRH